MLWYFIDVEKLMKIKGILEPTLGDHHTFETKKEEAEHYLSVGSSYLQDSLNNDEVNRLNRFI